jgi:hypothetical protein
MTPLLWIVLLTNWHQSCDAIRHEKTRANLGCEFQLWELNAEAKRHGWAPVAEPLPLQPLPVARQR